MNKEKNTDLVALEIDGKEILAKPDSTILEVAKELGIDIPTFCHHEKLKPYGACRLCMVELIGKKGSKLVASCGYYVENGLKVLTSSPKVLKARKMLTELLLAMIPESKVVQKLARVFQVTKSRYHRETSYCILCGLCARYCEEVKGKDAVGSINRGKDREIAWVPLAKYNEECEKCFECIAICPTGVFPSNWGIANPGNK